MKKFYITFGFSHPLAKHHLELYANSEEEARNAAAISFPNRWAGIYTNQPSGTGIESSRTAHEIITEAKSCGWDIN